MRSLKTALRAALPVLGLLSLVGSQAAYAGSRENIYAVSFGNLVIESSAGFKRILVGEGAQAKQLAKYTDSAESDVNVVYSDDEQGTHVTDGCYRAPYLIKGRSYMYGFDQGEIPFQGGPCRR